MQCDLQIKQFTASRLEAATSDSGAMTRLARRRLAIAATFPLKRYRKELFAVNLTRALRCFHGMIPSEDEDAM